MNLIFRRGTLEDTEMFIQFLDEVYGDMPHKEWFYLDPPDTVREMMADGTMELWVVIDGVRIAAAFSVLHPGLASFNYGYDLGLTEKELLRVIHMDTTAVHRNYRGLGLQREMVHKAEGEFAEKGNQILLCTVHPDNSYSLQNMLREGYQIQKRVGKYGSERFILRKDI